MVLPWRVTDAGLRGSWVAPDLAVDGFCDTKGFLEIESCFQRLLTHIFWYFSNPGRLSAPHVTKKQTEVQKKYFISTPKERVLLAPRAKISMKKFSTFTFLSWLASTKTIDPPFCLC